MSRPVILELCACEGGMTAGLMAAGFDVIAVDSNRNRLAKNPARWSFVGDAFDALAVMGDKVDGTAAGWPCQPYTRGRAAHRAAGDGKWVRLIAAGRDAQQATGLPYVIENVEDARPELVDPIMLCGRQFGLGATDTDGTPLVLDRHRLFEGGNGLTLTAPAHPPHDITRQVAGAYGGARRDKVEARTIRKGGYVPKDLGVLRALLGNPWMTQQGLFEAIPQAYGEYVGRQMMAHLTGEVAASLTGSCPQARWQS